MIGCTEPVFKEHRPIGGRDERGTCTTSRREFQRRRRAAPPLRRTCSPCSSARLESFRHRSMVTGTSTSTGELASVAKTSRRGDALRSACFSGPIPHTRSRSSKRAFVGGIGRRVGSVRAARKATSRQRNASRLKRNAKFQAARSCCEDVRETPRTAQVSVTYIREVHLLMGDPSVPAIPSRAPPTEVSRTLGLGGWHADNVQVRVSREKSRT